MPERVTGVDATGNSTVKQVIGNKQDAAATDIGSTSSIVAYLKGILNAVRGAAGLTTFPSAAVPANGVSVAEVLRDIWGSLCGTASGENGVQTFPAAAAPGNNVSLAEVIRAIYDRQLGDGTNSNTNGRLGKKVSKAAANLPATTTQDIFVVSGGRVLVTLLTGEVTTVVQNQTCNLKVTHDATAGGDVDLASNLDIGNFAAGRLLLVEGDGTALVSNGGSILSGIGSAGFVVSEGEIHIETGATNTGATSWELWYFPLDDGASVASA